MATHVTETTAAPSELAVKHFQEPIRRALCLARLGLPVKMTVGRTRRPVFEYELVARGERDERAVT
jgi:hypothetical protein